ncbi:hypothetical protein RBH26_06295 [Natronolimnohabitans sp. A-GB9]|uniref:hypothetical protein n=1 Tax=Natronolimnohabitans sp. A-GB9 TaxID=3069757 RepID=UPI0027B15092|nr:hypothetical protein [Natronolimnohabitans sp. A-GB9]MDQ2050091.1 hypothetical protein [Natronolimnohabitans sp. A-GB9]
MATELTLDDISLTNQLVLLGVVDRYRNDETPVQTHEIRHVCTNRLENVDTGVVGTVTEADVTRSLYRLEAEGFVEEVAPEGTSPTGKGRPAYTLDADPEAVYEGVDDELIADE